MRTDEELRRNVEEELSHEPSLDATGIGVAANDEIVTLSGHVSSYAENIAAERAAARVLGVRAIVGELQIKLPPSTRVTDEEIAQAAFEVLSWTTMVPKNRIWVRVDHGWLTLEGDVYWHYQKAAAYSAVSGLTGVKGISDKIVVKQTSLRPEIKAHIEAALERRFGDGKRRLTIETRGDHVTLRGIVDSLAEREEIERAAWTTAGVCHVNNNVSVSGRGRRRLVPLHRKKTHSGGSHMPANKLKEFLDQNNVKYEVITHSTAYTAQEIASLTHIRGKELAKTVIVKIDGALAMAVLPASYQVDLPKLKTAAGAKRIELADESEFRDRFPECETGAMPPFGQLYGMPVFVDESLTRDKEIAFSAGSHHELIRLSFDDFVKLVRPKIVTFAPAIPAAARL